MSMILASAVRFGDTVTIAYTVPTGADAKPLLGRKSGMQVASFAGVAVTNNMGPTPTLRSAIVDGDQLVLDFDLSVTAGLHGPDGGTTAPAAFTMTVNGTAREVSSVYIATRFRIGQPVTLTLASAVTASDTVTAGFTIPTGADAHPLMDTGGELVASFADAAVTNVTATPRRIIMSSATAQPGYNGQLQCRLHPAFAGGA